MLGASTSGIEVSLASSMGFWLLLGEEELFVSFSEFPWFKKATIEELATIEWPTPNHLYWPLIDVDLSVESIRTPGNFPLVSRAKQLT
ncbi:MAG: DUF2442 domain-containing protein [Sulfuricella sp.]|jgi:hypothetical protein